MKIAYYLPSLEAPGGLERIITFKANYFAGHEYEVTIITSELGRNTPYFPLSPSVKHVDIAVPFDNPYNQSRISKLLKYPFRYTRFKKRFTQILKEIHPDILVSTLRRELNFITKINDGSIKIGEFHVTRYAYGAEAIYGQNPIIGLIKQYWNRNFVRNLSQMEKIVLLTNEEAEFWPELHNKIVIPNPIIIPLNQKSDCKARKVIAAGRYAPQKGFDMLIKSWATVIARHPDWTLYIYGDGSLRHDMQEQVDRLQLTSNCLLEHTVQNITEKYCESSIFVLSSRYEGFGMVIAEAMGCGLPVVSFACPCGPKDIIDNGKNGLLADKENTEDLATKICYLIENEKERLTMGNYAYMTAQKYLMENIASEWKKLFESVTKKH